MHNIFNIKIALAKFFLFLFTGAKDQVKAKNRPKIGIENKINQ